MAPFPYESDTAGHGVARMRCEVHRSRSKARCIDDPDGIIAEEACPGARV
jgi:hypothetical protein